jgi:hypothetical protein
MRNYESEAAALRNLKPSTKVLALVLAARMNDRDDDWPGRPICWPSLNTLVEDTDLKERAVRYAIDELVEARVIRIYKERKPGARWCHNVYEWTAPVSPNYHPNWMKRPDAQKDAVGARLSKEGWEYCEQNQVGPHAATAEHPEFILPAEQPTLIEVTSPADDTQPPTKTDELTPKPRKKTAKTTHKTTIPEGWRPDEKTLARTRERYPSMPIDIEVDKFVAYWLDRGEKRANWNLTWNRWCANGNGIAKGAWTQPPTPGAPQAAPAINAATGKAATKEDFWYACIDHGIDPTPYVNFWKPSMGIPGDPGWANAQAHLDRHTGRA